jgi:formylglycine-generating enzyme required for sulfatase activity
MRRVLVVVSFGALAACAAVIGVDELEIGECKGGICAPDAAEDDDRVEPGPPPDTGADVSTYDASAPCDSGGREAGPQLVRVGPEANSFCIDRTEVTNKQYAAFLEAGVEAGTQAPECKWNTSFVPTGNAAGDDLPVAGIDWCDAVAFCKWSGKYLCGKAVAGKRVGSVAVAEVGDYNTHQWLIACSAQQNRYPYGSIQDASLCNTGELDAGKPVPVASLPGCQGSYPGVYDLLGNVWEWYDGPCRQDAGVDGGDAAPQNDECWVKGGGYNRAGPNIDCRVDGLGSTRDTKAAYIGFRCCSD